MSCIISVKSIHVSLRLYHGVICGFVSVYVWVHVCVCVCVVCARVYAYVCASVCVCVCVVEIISTCVGCVCVRKNFVYVFM